MPSGTVSFVMAAPSVGVYLSQECPRTMRRFVRPLVLTALAACCGAALAAPVDGRLFFAGEAVSPHAFSTAHGAWETGLRAADEVVTALNS